MTKLEDIWEGAIKLINQFLSQEAEAQGHYLTGTLSNSFNGKIKGSLVEGFAEHYIKYLEHGVPAQSASMKQWYFVRNFFMLRGLSEKEAGSAAAATIHVWMKEGMSTEASKRFSKTGARQHMVENAFITGDIRLNEYMSNMFDFAVDEAYHQVKSETI